MKELLLTTTTVLFFLSCFGQGQVNDATNANGKNAFTQKAKNYFISYLKDKKRTRLAVTKLVKTNGVKKTIYGQEIYEYEYELTIRVKSNIYISPHINLNSNGILNDFGYLKNKPTGYDAIFYPNTKIVKRGSLIKFKGTMIFEKTDNGWRVQDFKNKNYRVK